MILCDGTKYKLPMFDPVVATHINASHSLVQTLIDQINKEKLYARFFEGKKGLTFLDIGANIGLVSIYSAPACKRIVAVEPAPETFLVLHSITVGIPKIQAVRAALTPSNCTADFYVNDINSTASSTVNTYGTKIQVPGLTLDSLLKIYQLEHVDVCKCDAEGGEGESLSYEQLRNASQVIDRWHIECHNCPKSTWQEKMDMIVGRLARLEYMNIEVQGMTITASK